VATAVRSNHEFSTLAEMLAQLGDVPPERIMGSPFPPGSATEADLLAMSQHPRRRIWELVDGILVEKARGIRESLLAMALGSYLRSFVMPRNLGLISGADGMMRLFPGLIRIPDVAFVAWASIPGRCVPKEPIPDLVPDLAVEVLSEGNTDREMSRKRSEYFDAGVRLVWMIDPTERTVHVYTATDHFTALGVGDILDGGEVLPGFVLALDELFGVLDRRGGG
jgi:Uma2 family endonuclease